MRDRIDNQIKNYQQSQMQQQPTSINQTFQLAPQTNNNELESKYADNIDIVKNTFVLKTGLFVNKDFSTLWVKDATGNIRTFKTEEIIELDTKDKEIMELKRQINEMKGMITSANELHNADVNEPITEKQSSRVQSRKSSITK
jgi:hypothetical protein